MSTMRRSSFAFNLLLWLPLLLFALVDPFPWSHIVASPVLRRSFLLSIAVYLAAVAFISVVADCLAGLVRRMRHIDRTMGPSVLLNVSIASVASSLLIALQPLLRNAAERSGVLPEVEFMITGVLCCAAAAVVTGMASGLAPQRRVRPAWIGCCLGALGCWIAIVIIRFDLLHGDPRRLWILGFNALGLLVLIRAHSAALYGKASRTRLVALVATLGLAVPILAVAVPGTHDAQIAPSLPTDPQSRMNVLMIVVDTLRADHTSLTENGRDTTPNLREVAGAGSTYFSKASSAAPATGPSVRSLFTSQPPWRTPTSNWTIAQAFKAAGYEIGALIANSVIGGRVYRAGFDRFWHLGGHRYFTRSFFLFEVLSGGRNLAALRRMEVLRVHHETAPEMATLSRRWLREEREAPFFLYVHFMDPHWPWYDRGYGFVPEALRTLEDTYSHVDLLRAGSNPANASYRGQPRLEEIVGRYDEEIRFVDEALEEILDELESLGLASSTLVIVAADHGEEFFEQDGFGHGHDVFEELVSVSET